MGETRHRSGTLSKLGKMFGVSSTNLAETSPQAPPSSIYSPVSSRTPVIVSSPASLTPTSLSNSSTSLDSLPKKLDIKVASAGSANGTALSFAAQRKSSGEPEKKSGHKISPPQSASVSRASSVKLPQSTSQTAQRGSSDKSPAQGIVRAPSVKSPIQLHEASSAVSIQSGPSISKARFVVNADGTHEHHLRSAKRQEKLGSMLKDLMGAKKLRNEAVSAVPGLLSHIPNLSGTPSSGVATPPCAAPPTLFAGLVNQVKQGEETPFTPNQHSTSQPMITHSLAPTNSSDSRSFFEKYGRCQEVVGKGAFGVVRVAHKKSEKASGETLFAVKEFKRRVQETDKTYSRRLTSEFCISSSLKHPNIIQTLDLLQDAKGDYCEVMEYCAGGDLYTLIIAAGKLEFAEADCFFKQLIRGVNYMHEMGVAHRDLKPENVLLTSNGTLKITDFGNGECFRMAWETEIHFSSGVCGSSPYIAPEEYLVEEFDPRAVDIWACGVIYMAMRTGRQLWRLANAEDEFYSTYLEKRRDAKGYDPIESLKRARCRNVIYSILDPIPGRRITGKQILNSEWGREIKVCEAADE